MKKIICFLASLALIVSCSEESQVSTQNSDQSVRFARGNQLESYFNTMVASQSYQDFKALGNIFYQKMQYDGDGSDLESETQLLAWISSNLTKTTFTDYTSAENEYKNLRVAAENMAKDNSLFFDELKVTEEFDTFLPWGIAEEGPSNCEKKCRAAFNAKNQRWIREMKAYMASHNYSEYFVGVAVRDYEMKVDFGVQQLEDCLEYC